MSATQPEKNELAEAKRMVLVAELIKLTDELAQARAEIARLRKRIEEHHQSVITPPHTPPHTP